MYGFGLYGYSFYGLSPVKTFSINASGRIAELKSSSVNAGGHISQPALASINAAANIAQAKTISVQSHANISIIRGPESINASGTVANKLTSSINMSGYLSGWLTHAVNALGNIANYKFSEIYMGGKIVGFAYHVLWTKAHVGEAKDPYSINFWGNIGYWRQGYINARSVMSLERTLSIQASGYVIGYVEHVINAVAMISEKKILSLNAKGNISTGNTYNRQLKGKIADFQTSIINYISHIGETKSGSILSRTTVALRPTPKTINCSAKVGEKLLSSINAKTIVARKYILNYPLTGHLSERKLGSINIIGRIDTPEHSSINIRAYLMASPYYYLNGVDITAKMLKGLNNKGPDRRSTERRYPRQEKVLLLDNGFNAKEFEFDVFNTNEQAAFNYVRDVMDTTKDMRFYPGDSLWFHKVKYINAQRKYRKSSIYFVTKTKVELEKPWLYFDVAEERDLGTVNLPRTSSEIINRGHYNTPLDLLRVTARYTNGKHVKALTYTITDGLNDYNSLLISDKLLSDEVVELDEEGDLTCTYEENFSTPDRFYQDTVYSNCDYTGDKIVVNNNGYCDYVFNGPWPCIENMALDANINIAQGNPVVEVSTDEGASFTQAIAVRDIVNGVVNRYYLLGSDKYAKILVRFRCDASSRLELKYLKFTARRRTKAVTTPFLAAGSTRRFRISDNFDSSHSATIYARFRERRRAI
jgi:hypothetical protein